jgi:hypothetical protein
VLTWKNTQFLKTSIDGFDRSSSVLTACKQIQVQGRLERLLTAEHGMIVKQGFI